VILDRVCASAVMGRRVYPAVRLFLERALAGGGPNLAEDTSLLLSIMFRPVVIQEI
jgi:hypothetical protein